MRTKFYTLITILLLSSVLAACSGAALAQGSTTTPAASTAPAAVTGPAGATAQQADTTPRTLTVNGTGKAYLDPDIAYINIGVHTEGKDASTAMADNTTQAQKVIDALKAFGIAAKDIQTTNFSIYPQQQYDTQGKPTGEITYMVDNTVYVTVRDLGKIGDLLDAMVKSGANQISGIQFDVADKNEALAGARQAAIADARAQAEELAQAAGLTLGKIQAISIYGGSVPPIPMAYGKGGVAMDVAQSVPVNPGQLSVEVSVNIVYTIQ